MSLTNVQLIRARVKPEAVAAVDSAVRDVFSALQQDPPRGMRFASSRLSDGVTYFILLGVEEGIDNPLQKLLAYTEFLGKLPGWLAEPPSQDQLTVVGSYNLF